MNRFNEFLDKHVLLTIFLAFAIAFCAAAIVDHFWGIGPNKYITIDDIKKE